MAEIRATGPLPAPGGGAARLRLSATSTGADTVLGIDYELRLPHKTIAWTVMKVVRPTAVVFPLARDMTTIMCELERLHHQGYSLRQRAGGGLRGAWRAELLPAGGTRAALAWEIELRRPERELPALAGRASALDVPVYRSDEHDHREELLAEAMRGHAGEVRRRQAIDALIAHDPAAPVDDFLGELEGRGLLEPRDTAP